MIVIFKINAVMVVILMIMILIKRKLIVVSNTCNYDYNGHSKIYLNIKRT